MLNTLLRDADVMSMAHGLELRVPFLDPRLVTFLFTLRGEWKLDSNLPKHLLLETLRTSLPADVVQRPKRGFELPFGRWLRTHLRKEVEASLSRIKDGRLAEVLDYEAVNTVWRDFLQEKTSWSRPWSLYALQQWSEINECTAA